MNIVRVIVAPLSNVGQVIKEQKKSSSLTAKVIAIFDDMSAHARSAKATLSAKISPPVKIEKVLNPEQIESLQILTKIQTAKDKGQSGEDIPLSDRDKLMVRDFLVECMGNKKLNGIFASLLKSKLPEDIGTKVIEDVRTFSFKTMGSAQFPALNAKLKAVNESQESLPDKDKFTLVEWGRLNHLIGAVDYLRPLYDGHFLEIDDSQVGAFYQNAKSLEEDREQIEARFQKEVTETNHYQSGDIMTYIGSKWAQFRVRGQDREEWLTSHLVSKYGHMGKLHRTPEAVKTSEIFSKYRNVTFDLHEAALSHVWRLDIEKLINKNSTVYLAFADLSRRNGLDPDEVIVKLYQEIEREMHEKGQEKFSGIENVEQRRWDAGWADIGLKGGHRRRKERADRFEKIHQKLMKNPSMEPSEMICSEFATKATIAALIELDNRLTEKVKTSMQGLQDTLKFFGDEVQGEAKERAERAERVLKVLENNREANLLNFIHLPISNKERLKRMNPGRLVDLLKKKNCIKRVEPPPVVKAIFKKSVFK